MSGSLDCLKASLLNTHSNIDLFRKILSLPTSVYASHKNKIRETFFCGLVALVIKLTIMKTIKRVSTYYAIGYFLFQKYPEEGHHAAIAPETYLAIMIPKKIYDFYQG